MGRVAADLYGQQIGARLEDVPSFAKYLSGSSGNMAYDAACQGLRSSMLARVDDKHAGHFLREELNQVGCDTSHLTTDRDRPTALVLLSIKNRDTFLLIFYCDSCVDIAITASGVDEQYIASTRCLAITGTHLPHPQTREAVLTALAYARYHGIHMALGIDYRPVLWELTSLGDGGTRFIATDQTTRQSQEALHLFDVIVGIEEKFHIAGGGTNMLQVLSQVRGVSHTTLVCKRGALGCSAYTDIIPTRFDDGLTATGVRVEVLSVLGARDVSISSLLRGYFNDEGWEQTYRYANACGALVVSRHGYAPTVPSKTEFGDYLSRAAEAPCPDLDLHLNHLHHMTTRHRIQPRLYVMVFDHRSQLGDIALQCGTSLRRIPVLKQLVLRASRETANSAGLEGRAGLLYDGMLGQGILGTITGEGWQIGRPIELSGSRLLETEHDNIGSQLISWSQEHVVKCLVLSHPEDVHALRLEQKQKIVEVYRACRQSGHELLLEVILPAGMSRNDELYLRATSRFYNLGVHPDQRRLPLLTSAGWMALSDIIEQRDPHCRGVVIPGLDAPTEQLCVDFKAAIGHGVVKGFAVGRTLLNDVSRAWLKYDIDDAQLVARIKDNYLQLIAWWRKRR